MDEYLDFFNIYIMGVIETSFQIYFLAKILKKKIWPPFYFLLAVGAVIASEFIPVGTIVGFVVFVLLISICGTFVCDSDNGNHAALQRNCELADEPFIPMDTCFFP